MPVIPGIPFYSRPGIPDIHMKQLNNDGFLDVNHLEQWYHCFECGHEGFREDFDKESDCESCEQIAKGFV
jgi:hypothetical protein